MKNTIFFLCISFLIIISCDENEQPQDIDQDQTEQEIDQQESNFYALTVGNSWVYENYRYLNNIDTFEDTGVVDSISVISVEIINDNTFYKLRHFTSGNDSGNQLFKTNGEHFEFLRDSSGTLIDDKGFIKYVNNNLTERLTKENDWGDIYEKLLNEKEILNMDSGEFDCHVMTRYAKSKEGQRFPSTDYIYYSDGIGRIYETLSFIAQDTPIIVTRLESYVIN